MRIREVNELDGDTQFAVVYNLVYDCIYRLVYGSVFMSTITIRVSHTTRDALLALAKDEGTSMQQIIERGIELYRRQQILLATNAAYAALRENKPED